MADATVPGPGGATAPGRSGATAPVPGGATAPGSADVNVPGIDRAAVTGWFAANLPGVRPPLVFSMIAGGRSNLTYTVVDRGGTTWVLRRPPLSGVLASAHDIQREHRILSALAATPVPVPRPLGLCPDPQVTGAPFYVMAYVDGVVPRDQAITAAAFSEDQRGRIADELVEALTVLHGLDPAGVGLGELGRPDGYIGRQLRRWMRQWEQSTARELPAVGEVHRRLAARIPQQGRAGIVHGDYRLDNLILRSDGSLAAILDWELCTLGDPLADVGLLLVYWSQAGDAAFPLGPGRAPSALPGFPTRAELAAAYGRASGRDLSELDFYVAFGYWKLAVILEGVDARRRQGAYGEGERDVDGFAGTVAALAELALDHTGRAGR